MQLKISLLLTAILFVVFAFGQKSTLNGYITDKKTGERLLGASVFFESKNTGTTSNSYGFYSITLPSQTDSMEVKISYTGYAVFSKTILLNKDHSLNVELEPIQDLGGVTVVASKKSAIQNRTQMSSIDLPIETINSLPAFLGEVDVMKAIQKEV